MLDGFRCCGEFSCPLFKKRGNHTAFSQNSSNDDITVVPQSAVSAKRFPHPYLDLTYVGWTICQCDRGLQNENLYLRRRRRRHPTPSFFQTGNDDTRASIVLRRSVSFNLSRSIFVRR